MAKGLHYELFGEGPITVFLHGFLESSTMWEPLNLTELPGTKLLIDLPGHALGQMGVSFSNTFLAADASWGGSKLPTFLGRIIQEDKNAYIRTFEKLQKICPSITVHTTHVIEAHE